MKKILIIEDEKHILQAIRDALEGEGFFVLASRDGRAGYDIAMKEDVDLLILDVMLPGMDGFEICAKLRNRKKAMPIIMLTAKSAEADKIQGLGLGVDDYMTKPFSVKELIARIHNRFKRTADLKGFQTQAASIQKIGNVKIDFTKMTAFKGDEAVIFTKKEYDILRYLLKRKGEVVSRNDLLDAVWGLTDYPLTRTVDTFIARIRKKIEDDPARPRHLISIRDAGYKLDA